MTVTNLDPLLTPASDGWKYKITPPPEGLPAKLVLAVHDTADIADATAMRIFLLALDAIWFEVKKDQSFMTRVSDELQILLSLAALEYIEKYNEALAFHPNSGDIPEC